MEMYVSKEFLQQLAKNLLRRADQNNLWLEFGVREKRVSIVGDKTDDMLRMALDPGGWFSWSAAGMQQGELTVRVAKSSAATVFVITSTGSDNSPF